MVFITNLINEQMKTYHLLSLQTANYRNIIVFLMVFCSFCFVQSAYSNETYTLDVGGSVTISQTPYGGGYIDNVGLADFIDPHLSFCKNYNGTATITVNSYFDYTATVKLVFIERYTYYLGHTRAEPYYKNVDIKCRYQAPDPGKKVTKVLLPERFRAYIGEERIYITPTLEPTGAKANEVYWGNEQGTATFTLYSTGDNDGSGILRPISPGIGRAYVVIDDDWTNLKASTVIEVVDPNHLPPNAVFLPREIEISIGNHATLEPILIPENTSTSFTWESDNANVASVSYGKVTGVSEGTTTISVTTANKLTDTCIVKVVSQNGKDDEEGGGEGHTGTVDGHEYVDLGLSVKWATCNIGATSPESFGNYYAWGETTTKSTYSWENYKFNHGDIYNLQNIGSDIKGSSYDAAYKSWGTNWRMPTEIEAGELISKCTFEEQTQNGVDGYLVTGTNGASIFIPSAGNKVNSGNRGGCVCWTSNIASNDDWYATALDIRKNKNGVISPTTSLVFRYFGLPIRAVTSASNQILPTSINLNTTNVSLQVGETKLLTATVLPSGASQSVIWSVEEGSDVASVNESGLITAKAAGTATIRATSTVKSSVYKDCTVTVTEPAPEPGTWSGNTLTIGDDATSSGYEVPYYTYYKYSTTQMLYTPTEIGKSGTISSIAFKVESSTSFATSEVKVYLGHKSSKFSGTSDYVSSSNLTLVYSGSPTLGQATGWETLAFNHGSFTYNGTDNLVVVVTKEASSYTKSLNYYCYTGNGYTLYRRSDDTANYADVSNTSYNYTASTSRPAVRMVFGVPPTSITLNPTSVSLQAGETTQLIATVLPSDASQSVTWSVQEGSDIVSVSESGLVTAKAAGTAIVRATSSVLSSIWAKCTVTVVPVSPIIQFADAKVKALCVANWDSNGNGELSEAEAAAVTSLGEVFKGNAEITSFNELQYFTGLTSIDEEAFYDCEGLTSITIPESVKSIGRDAFYNCI